jgi:hydrogenase/urease accessory protein HupE
LGVARRGWTILVLAACLIPASAEAHAALQGMGGFWSGVAHLLTSLDQLAFLFGLAIWTSFYGRRTDACVIGTAFVAVFGGALLGAAIAADTSLDSAAPIAGLMTVVGLAGAARLRCGVVPLLGVASAGGLVCGAASSLGAVGPSIGLFSLGGSIASTSLLSYGLLASRGLETEWGRVVLRVIASWIGAIGLMMLAFSIARHIGRG